MGNSIVGEGKIPIEGELYIDGKAIPNTKFYIHIKGYSRARVTHVDVESESLRAIIKPHHSDYPEVDWNSDKVDMQVKDHSISIVSQTLGKLIKLKGNLYVGGKGKGIFLGFHKEQIIELEKFGCEHSICPKSLKHNT